MRKKSVQYILLGNIIALLATFAVNQYAFAWFAKGFSLEFENEDGLLSSNAAYYGGGDGTLEHPYIINQPRHLYNLAWLQDLGFYDDQAYYFTVQDDIDMTGLEIPPIGIDGHPFISNFAGNDHVIYNLTVNTYFGDGNTYVMPSDTVFQLYSSRQTLLANKTVNTTYAGLFGYISNKTINNELTIATVSNFYVANSEVKTRNIIDPLVGIIAGYVDGNLYSAGAYNSKISFDKERKSGITSSTREVSKYALIGDYNVEKIEWVDAPVNGDGESLAYGGNFDVNKLNTRLNLIYANKTSGSPSNKLPNVTRDGNGNINLAVGEKIPLTIAGNPTSDKYTGNDAEEKVSSENIGYYLGDKNSIETKTITFGGKTIKPSDQNNSYKYSNGQTPRDAKKTPRQFFKRTGNANGGYAGTEITVMSDDEFASLPANIRALIPEDDAPNDIERTMIRLNQRWSGSIQTNQNDNIQDDQWNRHGSISYYGQIYTGGNPKGIYLPNNGIWFRPKNPGFFRFVMWTGDDSGNNQSCFSLIKVTRSGSSAEDPFSGTSLSGNKIWDSPAKNLPPFMLFYYEYNVTQAEINANTEFVLLKGDNTGAYFLHLDIGISGGQGEGGEKIGQLNQIGFVKNNTTDGATYQNGDELSSYLATLSSTAFVITAQPAAVGYASFKRYEDAIHYASSTNNITLTPFGKTASVEDATIL